MKRLLLILLLIGIQLSGFSQVGINTTNPNAQLDIRSSSQVTPSNTDGILIPKIDAFPVTNPTVAQQGMMIYLTTVSGGKQPGFYYWDNTGIPQWRPLGATLPNGTTIGNTMYWDGTTWVNNSSFLFNDGASVGINTIAPSSIFTVKQDGIGITQEDATGNSKIGFFTVNGNAWLQTHTDTDLSFATNDGPTQMVLQKATGNLGINTLAPSEKLEVDGKTKTTDLQVTNGAASGRVLTSDAIGNATWQSPVTSTGWLITGNSGTNPAINFIGTTDDADLIFKRQNIKSGRIGMNLTSFGRSSLQANTTGYQNAAFGSSALQDNAIGHNNAAFGFNALQLNTQGRLNTAVGSFALAANVDGNSNTGLGEQALAQNNSGSGNTATGYQSMMQTTTGEYNTTDGHTSLHKNTIGSYNVAIGSRALLNDGSGSNATAIGYESMANANSATGGYISLNTAVGYQSLKGSGTAADNTGNNNTAIGYQGLLSNSKGESNIAVGPQALYNNSVSSKNIAIGDKALFTQSMVNGGLAFDAHNIAIGYEALYTTNPTRTVAPTETGVMNVAVGNYALTKNTTGRSNTAFGTNTLANNTVGGWNTALGHRALFSNTTAQDNVAVGTFSMQSNTTGENNTAVGMGSLMDSTIGNENTVYGLRTLERNKAGSGATAIGTRAMQYCNVSTTPFFNTNVAIGYEALRGGSVAPNNNTGYGNTVVGYQSMMVNSTGSGNSALGDQSLTKNTTGSFNNAFGMFSMYENTTGSQNNAHGSESLMGNTTGDNNSGFGYRTLSGNTVGSDNTAFGNAALLVNKTGNKNVAIGSSALAQQSFVNGNIAYDTNNVAIGYHSLYINNSTAATNGIQNTGIGNYSLEANTTGINNTSIGYRSGSNITTGSNNIAIGANSTVVNATVSNQMSIANMIYGEAMDNITTARFSIGAVPTVKDKLYVYSTQTTLPPNDDGQSAIYGYRTRTTQNDGSAYSREGSNSAVKGFNLWGDQYSFGVSGFSYNDTTPGYYRSGGVLGAVWDGAYWASLGYRASSLVNYGIYATSALATGTGRMAAPSQQYTIGGGFYGGLIGSWSKGEMIGNVNSGKFFASYNSGDEYTTGKQIEIVETGNSKTAAYTVTSTDVIVYKKGKIALQNGTAHVAFDADYARLLGDAPIVTTTPMGQCNGIYIESVDKKGFTIRELNNGTSNVSVSWIAVGDRIDSDKAVLPLVLEKDFDNNINEVMFNENDRDGKGKAAWSEGNKIKFGELPESLKEKTTKKE